MERFSIKYLILILFLSGCQIAEVTNTSESIELIPDLSIPYSEEVVEAIQLPEISDTKQSTPEIISGVDCLVSEISGS